MKASQNENEMGEALLGEHKAKMVMDVQVVESLRAKDTQAFRSLIERLQQPMTAYLHRLVGDREVALDLAQDTFLQVYKEIGKTSQDSTFSTGRRTRALPGLLGCRQLQRCTNSYRCTG